ncbi:MAG: DUF4258 domain-containing protein [Bacteroidia bacterium]
MKPPRSFLSKSSPYIILLLLAAVLFFKFVKTQNGSNDFVNPKTEFVNHDSTRHQNVIPLSAQLIFTKHARCRMDCRHIDESEIREIIKDGKVNEHKSNPNDQPCPTFAIEGTSHDNQQLRIVFAKCDDEVKVITCIDLKNDFECDCK